MFFTFNTDVEVNKESVKELEDLGVKVELNIEYDGKN